MANNTFCTANHILVGLGGTGGKILREFKMRMFEEFPTAEERKLPVALLSPLVVCWGGNYTTK